ncbi:unnamed protein product [Paramecium pentaurelia]|uniref:Transmembrane protein n=2 Tax=Paramecium TaxID=5884 RepID=A0A8S1SU73_9CILI|nr:unnamed protein product [Paramecium pentaurelia]
MKIALSLLILHIFLTIPTLQYSQSYSCRQLKIQQFRYRIRGQYKNILQEKQGAFISNKDQIYFAGDQFNKNPFRSEVYYVDGGRGYTIQEIGKYMIIDLLQTYEINRIILWVYDRDLSLRTFDLKVYIKGPGEIEQLIYQNNLATTIIKIKFSDAFVKQILIYNSNGSSVNQYLHLFNLQAYYKL